MNNKTRKPRVNLDLEKLKKAGYKIRIDEPANYVSLFTPDLKTIRCRIRENESFSTPSTPEISDIAINSKCMAGCPYCYISSKKTGDNFENIVEKARDLWGNLTENERPFQIAIGGAGEPTLHPDFPQFCEEVRKMGIIPNYTTNGMHLTESVLAATRNHCGGVALSWHPHLGYDHFSSAINTLKDHTNNLNVHIVVGLKDSVSDLKRIYDDFKNVIKYFVLLPYQKVGRAKDDVLISEFEDAFKFMEDSKEPHRFALGALFYDYIKDRKFNFDIEIYDPEIFSGYRTMDDEYMILKHSSYDRRPKK